MDIIKLFQDHGVQYMTEGHKHCRAGWVNLPCPFCSDYATSNFGYHLGWNLKSEFFTCYRCGFHPVIKTLSLVLGVTEGDVYYLVKRYDGRIKIPPEKETANKKQFTLPSNFIRYGELDFDKHLRYLKRRGFDPEETVMKWKLYGTGPISKLGNIDYRFRLLIPYYWNGIMVSFDARDITGKSDSKYMACPKNREIIPHKEILYGNQETWESTGICVEGATDVWRLGDLSFAVSGIKYTPAQVRVIATTFKKVAVVFDFESQAQIQAKKLVAELRFRGVEAWNIVVKDDPGSMKQSEADELVNKILKL